MSIKTSQNISPTISASYQPLPQSEPQQSITPTTFCGSLKIIFRYLMSELKKKQRAFRIGFITILIVVTFVTALESSIKMVPLAFLKVAENDAGEADLIMSPTKSIIYNPENIAMYFFSQYDL